MHFIKKIWNKKLAGAVMIIYIETVSFGILAGGINIGPAVFVYIADGYTQSKIECIVYNTCLQRNICKMHVATGIPVVTE